VRLCCRALACGTPRIGKTRAIDYLRLLLAEAEPKVVTYHVHAERKPPACRRQQELLSVNTALQRVLVPGPRIAAI